MGCSMWWLRWGTGMFITLFGELIWVGLLVVGVEFDVVSRCRCGFRVFGLGLGLALVLNVAMVLVGRFLILFRIWFGLIMVLGLWLVFASGDIGCCVG